MGMGNGKWGMGSGRLPFELFPIREKSILYSLFPIPLLTFHNSNRIAIQYTL